MSHERLFVPEHLVDAELTILPSSPEPFEHDCATLLEVLREWVLNLSSDAKVTGLIVNGVDGYIDYLYFDVGFHTKRLSPGESGCVYVPWQVACI
jgi:hypothetical protein